MRLEKPPDLELFPEHQTGSFGLAVCDIRIRFNGQVMKRDGSPAKRKQAKRQDLESVVKREIYQSPDHPRILQECVCHLH
jgi:hypothetical protein